MNFKKLYTILFIAGLINTHLFANTNAGNTGLAFLKIGAGSRAIGMGEAYTAIANDASATYWNPAGLSRLTKSEVMFTHNKWFQDISHNFLAVSFSKGNNGFGISFTSFNVNDIPQRSSVPTESPLGLIEAHDILLGLSWARAWSDVLQYGITLKYLYEKIYLDSAFGFAADLGMMYQSPITGLSFGATVQNLGKTSKMRDESTKLPMTIKAGTAYKLPVQIAGTVMLSADIIKILDSSFHTNFGIEYDVYNKLALRAGYLTGHDERGIQGGIGFDYNRYQIDYGYAPFSSDIGNSHRISVSIKF